jgi:hypothetical protein
MNAPTIQRAVIKRDDARSAQQDTRTTKHTGGSEFDR